MQQHVFGAAKSFSEHVADGRGDKALGDRLRDLRKGYSRSHSQLTTTGSTFSQTARRISRRSDRTARNSETLKTSSSRPAVRLSHPSSRTPNDRRLTVASGREIGLVN